MISLDLNESNITRLVETYENNSRVTMSHICVNYGKVYVFTKIILIFSRKSLVTDNTMTQRSYLMAIFTIYAPVVPIIFLLTKFSMEQNSYLLN